jgi:transcription initiation factor TFIIH subunit 1
MPPTTTTATAQYKKKDGSLAVGEDKKHVCWTPVTTSTPSVVITVAEITNLQQTPATSKAIALKIVLKDESYVFTFNHKEHARKEQETVTDALRNIIAANKAKDASQLAATAAKAAAKTATPPPAVTSDGGPSAAMVMAKAVSSSKAADEAWYDDGKLKSDFNLQRSLLESNRALQERFNQALKEKPESVSISQFTGQFWSARLHLLRAHAIEKAQKQGEYNVLPEIKFVRKAAEKEGEPDTKQLQITKEQIHLIFKQYPVVKDAYNENVPPLSQGEFWTKFFGSRLLKKLKGEKITQHDPPDRILDRYLDRPEGGPANITHIPHWMDLEGNEQNHSQKKGNRPDQDMRPSSYDKVPILRVLNNLSEKMMAHVTAEDGEAHGPIGMDEDTYEQVRLRDLANEDVDNRIKLRVKEQQRLLGTSRDDLSADAKLYAQQDPAQVLATLRSTLQPSRLGSDEQGTLRLDRVVGYRSDDDDDEDADSEAPNGNGTTRQNKKPRLGSHAAMATATSTILTSIRTRRLAHTTDPTSLHGLSPAVHSNLVLTHNTTIEFLHYFWALFLSGDATRTAELAELVRSLDRSLDRIDAVAAQADAERDRQVAALQAQIRDYKARTGKTRRVDFDVAVPGGKRVVEAMLGPTVGALAQATAAYRKALEEQTREGGGIATAAVGVGGAS